MTAHLLHLRPDPERRLTTDATSQGAGILDALVSLPERLEGPGAEAEVRRLRALVASLQASLGELEVHVRARSRSERITAEVSALVAP